MNLIASKTFWFLCLTLAGLMLGANGQGSSEEEKGKKLITSKCIGCHAPSGWMHSKEDWEFIVPDMSAKGGEAPSDGDARLMVAYLAKHFGTGEESSSKPAGSEDEKGKKLLDQVCTPCHEPAGWMKSRSEWEVIAPDHAARGGHALADADMKTLVDYLTKHFGPPK
jgi:mono/diheme cytochrome c family protein